MRGQGRQIFVDELARFAAGVADARVTTIAESAAAPVRVAVRGRAGVGRSTVARALDGAGGAMAIRAAESDADLDAHVTDAADVMVYVITEVLKPEDSEVIAAARRPVVAVLNKADLAGFAGDGPVAATRARCAHIAGLAGMAGVPVEPMIGLLAVAGLDDLPDAAWAALHGLAAHPGGAFFDASFDGFLAADGPVSTDDRLRLLDALDLFGTALAVAAVRKGATPAQLRVLLRRVSCVDAVLAKINAVGAEVRTGGCSMPSRHWRRSRFLGSDWAGGSLSSLPTTTQWWHSWPLPLTWPKPSGWKPDLLGAAIIRLSTCRGRCDGSA